MYWKWSGLTHGIFDAQFLHLFGIESIEIDSMHEIHETIGGIILGQIIDLLKERYEHASEFQIKAFHSLRKCIRLIQRTLTLYSSKWKKYSIKISKLQIQDKQFRIANSILRQNTIKNPKRSMKFRKNMEFETELKSSEMLYSQI